MDGFIVGGEELMTITIPHMSHQSEIVHSLIFICNYKVEVAILSFSADRDWFRLHLLR